MYMPFVMCFCWCSWNLIKIAQRWKCFSWHNLKLVLLSMLNSHKTVQILDASAQINGYCLFTTEQWMRRGEDWLWNVAVHLSFAIFSSTRLRTLSKSLEKFVKISHFLHSMIVFRWNNLFDCQKKYFFFLVFSRILFVLQLFIGGHP